LVLHPTVMKKRSRHDHPRKNADAQSLIRGGKRAKKKNKSDAKSESWGKGGRALRWILK